MKYRDNEAEPETDQVWARFLILRGGASSEAERPRDWYPLQPIRLSLHYTSDQWSWCCQPLLFRFSFGRTVASSVTKVLSLQKSEMIVFLFHNKYNKGRWLILCYCVGNKNDDVAGIQFHPPLHPVSATYRFPSRVICSDAEQTRTSLPSTSHQDQSSASEWVWNIQSECDEFDCVSSWIRSSRHRTEEASTRSERNRVAWISDWSSQLHAEQSPVPFSSTASPAFVKVRRSTCILPVPIPQFDPFQHSYWTKSLFDMPLHQTQVLPPTSICTRKESRCNLRWLIWNSQAKASIGRCSQQIGWRKARQESSVEVLFQSIEKNLRGIGYEKQQYAWSNSNGIGFVHLLQTTHSSGRGKRWLCWYRWSTPYRSVYSEKEGRWRWEEERRDRVAWPTRIQVLREHERCGC